MAGIVEEYIDFHPKRKKMTQASKVDRTYLSTRLKARIANRQRREFSWVTPRHHGLKGWNHGESPVPPVIRQEGRLCIPYQVYNCLKFQINLMVTYSPVPVEAPEVSLPYLVDTFREMPASDRTLSKFLSILHWDGFLTTQDYNAQKKEISLNPVWYYIHFCKAFGPEEIGFEDQLKNSILFHGGAIAEVIVPPWGLNPGGQISGEVQYVKVDESSETTRALGHALLMLGWRVRNGSILMYQNSYGLDWGFSPYAPDPDLPPRDDMNGYGFIRSGDLHHVYVPQVCKWW